jgi:hypothetical protein
VAFLHNRVQELINRIRLLSGITAGLDDWVEAFNRGEKTDQEEFAKLLGSFLKM